MLLDFKVHSAYNGSMLNPKSFFVKGKSMSSPFPGMDPYLEGYLWPDVHQRLATEISKRLTPRLRPRYVARLAVQTVQDETPQMEIGIIYPDVEILKQRNASFTHPQRPSQDAITLVSPPITPALTMPMLDFEVRLVTVEVYDVANNQLVTSIEILSPLNKREPGLSKHRQKRERLETAGVHLLEIDLLRRGQRPAVTNRLLHQERLENAHYLVTLVRAGSLAMEVWPVSVQERLPVIAVPLHAPDADVPLDLAEVLTTIYDEAAYDLSIDYSQPPPPPPLM